MTATVFAINTINPYHKRKTNTVTKNQHTSYAKFEDWFLRVRAGAEGSIEEYEGVSQLFWQKF